METQINTIVAQTILKIKMSDLTERMETYLIFRKKLETELSSLNILDTIQTVFEKALNGTRKWDPNAYSFNEFIFGVLKSEVSGFKQKKLSKKQQTVISIEEISEIPLHDDHNLDVNFIKEKAIEELEKLEATDDEILIFDCWVEGIFDTSEIATSLNTTSKEIYAIKKKLLKKIEKIQPIIRKYYE